MPPSTPPSPIEWAQHVIAKRDSDFGKLCTLYGQSPKEVSQKMSGFVARMQGILRQMGRSDAIDGETGAVENIARDLRASLTEKGAEVDAGIDETIITPLALIQVLAQRIVSAPPAKKEEKPAAAPAASKKMGPPPLQPTAPASAKKPRPSPAKPALKAAKPLHETPDTATEQPTPGDDDVPDFEYDPPPTDGRQFDLAELGIEEPTTPARGQKKVGRKP
ncbi:MAG: hypothetical protein PHS73_04790 [Candidatus Peribacteraceae bacterium]|nr:hypothetical protein [Candidatus Peribacteraceae bacterium]